ncbi:hypothetical protein RIdsm_04170 [Roseovarius indicus]|uniref:Uncharacterized protein n=2 Tax=Roseovarius indicus TaxID=540747 RepID=A0A5P3AI85_9RHOB|nr:hypothetical protein [Roseovarius indicus]QEW28340.1 hypothetical protein RIdsm_04170 [Roseovarius indicus]SFE12498.1 hypothetical protein SAMN04488031_105216 [Roseovarius indicus]
MTCKVSKGRIQHNFLIVAVMVALAPAAPALATTAPDGDDRGSGRDNATGPAPGVGAPAGNTATGTTMTRRKLPNVIYRRSYVANIEEEDLRTAIERNRRGESIVVEGFSKRGSTRVFELLLLDRDRALRLLSQLDETSDRTERWTFIQRAASFASDEHDNLLAPETDDLSVILFPDAPPSRSRVEKINALNRFEGLLRGWMRHPMDGTLETPGLPDG